MFLERIPSAELASLVSPGLVSLSLNMAAAEAGDVGDGIAVDGVQTVDGQHTEKLVKALLDDETAPRPLKLLNTTLYSLTISQLRELLTRHRGVLSLAASIGITIEDDWKADILQTVAIGESLEQVEIVLWPQSDVDVCSIRQEDLVALSAKCKQLAHLKINTLRKTSKASVEWMKTGEEWKVKITEAKVLEVQTPGKKVKVVCRIFSHLRTCTDIVIRKSGVLGLENRHCHAGITPQDISVTVPRTFLHHVDSSIEVFYMDT